MMPFPINSTRRSRSSTASDCASFYVGLASFEKRIDDSRKSAQIGHEIGNHSVNHPCSGNFWWSKKAALEDYTVQQMENELDEASRRIESLASVKPKTFAYPCGMTFIGRGETRQSYVPLVARRFLAGRGFMGESANDPAFCDMACLVARGFDFTSFATIKLWMDDAMRTRRVAHPRRPRDRR